VRFGERVSASQEEFLVFGSQNGVFWCNSVSCLCTIYTSVMPVSVILTNRMSDHLLIILCGRQKGYIWLRSVLRIGPQLMDGLSAGCSPPQSKEEEEEEVLYSHVATHQTLGLYMRAFLVLLKS